MKCTMNNPKTIKQSFPVLEMSCAACASRVDKTLNRQPGVISASVNYATATATVEYIPEECSPESLKSAIQAAGYDLIIETEQNNPIDKAEEAHLRKYRKLKRRTLAALCLSLPLSIISMCFMDLPYASYLTWLLSTPVVFGLGRDFYINAWTQLKHGSANMDTLVANSTGIAYAFSLFNLFFPDFWLSRGIQPQIYFEASSMIITFILLGRTLEERAKGNTSAALRKLMGLQPKTVIRLTTSGEQEEVPVDLVRSGDRLQVKPGEKIAVDGIVCEGSSFVDESMLSGEPVAVKKQVGDKVYAGTINQKGSFIFTAERVGSETMLSQIIRMVQEAQGSKAPVQKTVDRIAAVFVPAILSIALLTFFIWLFLSPSEGFTHGLLAAVTVLIIACPCALGLATPTAIMVGIGKGAESGILIKDAECLEVAKQIDTVVLDKTGTLTEGKPVLTDLLWETESPKLRNIFFSLEKRSEHPLAEAVVSALKGESLPLTDFESLTGTGIYGKLESTTYYAGNLRLLNQRNITISNRLAEAASRFTEEAKTVIWFANETEALAVAAITDQIKDSSKQAISTLKERGIEVYMLTGDNQKTATVLAQKAGITHFRAEVLPAQKADFIRELQQQGKQVAMVGDGINDSAALAQADLSIAMGKGSDIAIDVAKMTIISSDLRKIADAIHLSTLTVRTIRENLFWAFIYNLIGIPVAAGILYPVCGFLLNPMIAGAAMAMSSVSVVTNSLRLRKKKLSTDCITTPASSELTVSKETESCCIPISTRTKTFQVEGMMCDHCRSRVEKVLNGIEGVTASVTLDPPVATLTFNKEVLTIEELQQVIDKKAGDYRLS